MTARFFISKQFYLLLLISIPIALAMIASKKTGSNVIRQQENQPIPKTAQVLGEKQVSHIEPTGVPNSLPKIGIVVSDYANKTGELSSLQGQLGVSFSTVSVFKQFGLPTNNMLILDDLAFIKSQNIRLLVAWEPWNPQEGLQQKTDYLKEIGEGKHDEYIKQFAHSVKEYGAPVTIRFGHEMNGNWYPWGKRPDEYIQAYRRIVLIFKNEAVTNVSWMWSINADPLENIEQYYPGDAYVDSIGLDGFNFGTSAPKESWKSFERIFYAPYTTITARYQKPIIISETASAEDGGDKAKWITDMFTFLSRFMPAISEIVWFHQIKEADWRVDSSHAAFAAFTTTFK